MAGFLEGATKFVGALTILVTAVGALDQAVAKLLGVTSVIYPLVGWGVREQKDYPLPLRDGHVLPGPANNTGAEAVFGYRVDIDPKLAAQGWVFVAGSAKLSDENGQVPRVRDGKTVVARTRNGTTEYQLQTMANGVGIWGGTKDHPAECQPLPPYDVTDRMILWRARVIANQGGAGVGCMISVTARIQRKRAWLDWRERPVPPPEPAEATRQQM